VPPTAREWRVTGGGYRGQVKRIGIAGGIGAGKTAVAMHLTGLGWPVVDADEIAHDVTPRQPASRAARRLRRRRPRP
jgi:dephospho-CoA kinase